MELFFPIGCSQGRATPSPSKARGLPGLAWQQGLSVPPARPGGCAGTVRQVYRSLPGLVELTFTCTRWLHPSQMPCYPVIILNLMLPTSVLSMVLPIQSMLCAMCLVPRPSQQLWMATNYYTEVGAKVRPKAPHGPRSCQKMTHGSHNHPIHSTHL